MSKKIFLITIMLMTILLSTGISFADGSYFVNELGEEVSFRYERINNNFYRAIAPNTSVGEIVGTGDSESSAKDDMINKYNEYVLLPFAEANGKTELVKLLNSDPIEFEDKDSFNEAVAVLLGFGMTIFNGILGINIVFSMYKLIMSLTPVLMESSNINKQVDKKIQVLESTKIIGIVGFLSLGMNWFVSGVVNLMNSTSMGSDLPQLFNTLIRVGLKANPVILGIAILTAILAIVLDFIKLAASSGNPQERSKALKKLLLDCILIAGLGSVYIIYSIAYNIF